MGARINPEDKIVQRCIGFNFRQIRFFNEHPEFKPDIFCREAIDAQIAIIDNKYLKKKDETQIN